MKKEYQAIRCKQTHNGSWLVFFSASAFDIDVWGGIPEKKNFDSIESTGFQRSFKDERLDSLISFYSENKNILQNPLLCAPRKIGTASNNTVSFLPDENTVENDMIQTGKIIIDYNDFSECTLKELLISFREYLECRGDNLEKNIIDTELLAKLKDRLSLPISENNDEKNDAVGDDSESDQEELTIIESSHISDLWQEVSCRISILNEYGNDYDSDEILGFSKDSMISYLKPVIIVDGQHRLIGALEHAKKEAQSTDAMEHFYELTTSGGLDEDAAKVIVQNELCRHLPISLILSDDPAEHVFQFVVVNQKATPINNALLGTIVSTTLSSGELNRVAQRLKNADIQLEASQAVSFATRNTNSPFYGLVQTGINGEQAGKLPWTVMRSIVTIFKDLKGAKLFSDEDKTDYADLWRRRYLELEDGDSNNFDVWNAEEGLWRDVFIKFWSCIKEKFSKTTDPESHNYWGHTRSNLFNKVSLTILATDFFKYLCDSKTTIVSADDVQELVSSWLDGVDDNYFNRDWKLTVKKDTPGIRKQWCKLWVNYRRDPKQLPNSNLYKKI